MCGIYNQEKTLWSSQETIYLERQTGADTGLNSEVCLNQSLNATLVPPAQLLIPPGLLDSPPARSLLGPVWVMRGGGTGRAGRASGVLLYSTIPLWGSSLSYGTLLLDRSNPAHLPCYRSVSAAIFPGAWCSFSHRSSPAGPPEVSPMHSHQVP